MPVRPHDGGRGEREREVHQLEFRLLHPLCHCVAHSHTHRLGNHKQLGGGLPDSDLLYAALIHPLLRQIAALRQVQAGGEPESASFRNRKVPLPSDPNQLFSCPSDVQRAAIVCRTNHLRQYHRRPVEPDLRYNPFHLIMSHEMSRFIRLPACILVSSSSSLVKKSSDTSAYDSHLCMNPISLSH